MAAAVTGEEAGDPPLNPGPGLALQHALTQPSAGTQTVPTPSELDTLVAH